MYQSTRFECDLWQGVAVFTRLSDGATATLSLIRKGRNATESMIRADIARHGEERALATYAKLVEAWH